MASASSFFPLLLALALHVSTTSATVLHFTSFITDKPNDVSISIQVGSTVKGSGQLIPGREFTFQADANTKYFCVGHYNKLTAGFVVFDPTRDKGRADVYWRATYLGLDISYDKANWNTVVPWGN